MNKSYCPIPFTEIYVDNMGRYKLCCHAHPTEMSEDESLPFDYFFSDAMEEVRTKMMEGEEIKPCKKCKELESCGEDSYRLKAIRRFGLKSDVEKVRLKLRINGSSCNLACVMCHPYNSSTRRNELREIFGDDYQRQLPFFTSEAKSMKRNIWNDTIENINQYIHMVDEIHMTGGEPLQLPRHWEWIDKIPEEHAKNIKLSYDSNITELSYKNHHVLDLKEKFGKVHFGISCDHFGEKLELIRYPIDHKKFEENLKVIVENFSHSINTTVGLLNIADLHEIVDYYAQFGAIVKHSNIVSTPRFLSIRNLPQEMKDHYNEKYKDYKLVLAELNRKPLPPAWFDMMTNYLDALYNHRSLDWRSVWDVESYRS